MFESRLGRYYIKCRMHFEFKISLHFCFSRIPFLHGSNIPCFGRMEDLVAKSLSRRFCEMCTGWCYRGRTLVRIKARSIFKPSNYYQAFFISRIPWLKTLPASEVCNTVPLPIPSGGVDIAPRFSMMERIMGGPFPNQG